MRRSPAIVSRCVSAVFVVALFLLQATVVTTQQSLPWTGIARDEARSVDTDRVGAASVRSHALSADGRYVTFTANYPLLASDTNETADIYVRDRMTGDVELISVASDGGIADASSDPAAISGDGRHVAFLSSASNLVPDDYNGRQDVFVRDRLTQTTTLVSLGVSGEPVDTAMYEGISLSGDGRFVTFMAMFPGDSWWSLYLRDRDSDMNGVFDEPGLATTVAVVPGGDVGEWNLLSFATDGVISSDGRLIAFTAFAYRASSGVGGFRVFLLDRQTSQIVPVDVPIGDEGVEPAAHSLSLGDQHLAYVTNVNNLVEGDTDGGEDVFVYDIAAGTNAIVRATVPDVPLLPYIFSTNISADGRYVLFNGNHPVEPYGFANFAFAVDRQTQQTHEVGLRPDGSRTEMVWSSAMSADGSAIAFWGHPEVLAIPDMNLGVYVETAISLSPSEVEVPEEGGTYTIELTAPDNASWLVEHDPAISVTPESGTGSATIEVTIDANTTGVTRSNLVAIGSLSTTVRQLVPLVVDSVSPDSGPMGGGTEVAIAGNGFTESTTVTFGGVPATQIWFMSGQLLYAWTPAHARGLVDVVVSDGVSPDGTAVEAFRFLDVTPPVITHAIAGTLGQNGWYVSDVTVNFTVEDPESEVELLGCEDGRVFTVDGPDGAGCNAMSEGGFNGEFVEVYRDATPPTVSIVRPAALTYQLNEIVALEYSCDDNMSGVDFCAPNQPGTLLNTSAIGTFTFTVNANDYGGNTATGSVTYTVKAPSNVAAQSTAIAYRNSIPAVLVATLTSAGAPVAGRSVSFFVDNGAVGTATTDAAGTATVDVFANYPVGTHSIRADYSGDANTLPSSGNASLVILKAATFVTWFTPSPITYGTALTSTQLNATASVPGSFSYSPGLGTVLGAGAQTLSVTFTPSDSANYNGSSATVTLTVHKATPTITWPSPASITYGTPLGATQLNATATVAGVFNYMPATGSVLAAGTQTLSVSFTPADGANYNNAAANRPLTVTAVPLTIQTDNASKVYGESLPAFAVSGTGFVNGDTIASLSGTLSFSTSATATSAPGTYSVTPGGLASGNYSITFSAGTLTVSKANTAVMLTADPNPSRPNRDVVLQAAVSAVAPGAGIATGSIEFRENGTLLGTAALVDGVATLIKSFKKGTHPLTATFVGDANFNGSSGAATLSTN